MNTCTVCGRTVYATKGTKVRCIDCQPRWDAARAIAGEIKHLAERKATAPDRFEIMGKSEYGRMVDMTQQYASALAALYEVPDMAWEEQVALDIWRKPGAVAHILKRFAEAVRGTKALPVVRE